MSTGVPPEKVSRVLPAIERLGLIGSWRQPFPSIWGVFEHIFEDGDERLTPLRRAWKEAGLEEWLERHEATYTDKELRAATLIELGLEAGERDVFHEASMFDLTEGCPDCHAGAPQIAPLRIRPSALPKKTPMCQTLDFAYLVTEPLYQALFAADLTGLELMSVLDTKGDPLAWWQIVPRHVMPRMAPETHGWIRHKPSLGFGTPCSVCERDGYCVSMRNEVPQIAYRRSQLGDKPLPDVAETWESQGVWALHNGAVARGRVLVSPRVFDIFRRFKIRGIKFAPVMIVED